MQLKEEGKRIRQEVKDRYKTMTKSYQPIPELDELLEQKEEEYDTGDVHVKVLELNSADLSKHRLENIVSDESENEVVDDESDNSEEIMGMELQPKIKKPNPKTKDTPEESKSLDESLPKSKKELNKILKKQATSSLKKSKAFQAKRKMDKIKDKKKFRREQNQKSKSSGSKHAKKFKKESKMRRRQNK